MILDRLKSCKHLTKLDPDKKHTFSLIEKVFASGTDGIIIGGTQGITASKTVALLQMVRTVVASSLPVWIEVSEQEAIQPGADGYFVPVVLNTTNVEWLIGAHQKAFAALNFLLKHLAIDVDKILIPEGYIILNPACAAAKKTQANTDLTPEDIAGYCLAAKHLFKLPIIYLEYSGTLGSLEVVSQVKKQIGGTRLFYGGGISTPETAYDFSRYADTLIVGNLVYQEPKLLKSIVEAVKEK
jgi:putative glycerol-1-phosphate prenyltransferase